MNKKIFVFLALSLVSVGYAYVAPALAADGSSTQIPNPIWCETPTCLIVQVIKYIFGIIAALAAAMFIWGGVQMLTSGGQERVVQRAKETLVWASIGIVVIIFSWFLVKFILTAFTQSTMKTK